MRRPQTVDEWSTLAFSLSFGSFCSALTVGLWVEVHYIAALLWGAAWTGLGTTVLLSRIRPSEVGPQPRESPDFSDPPIRTE